MSNGDPQPASTASYIIICSGRIAASVTSDPLEQIKAVSDCAAQLVSYLSVKVKYGLSPESTEAISGAQHYLMDHMHTMKKGEAESKVSELFGLLDDLEHQFEGY